MGSSGYQAVGILKRSKELYSGKRYNNLEQIRYALLKSSDIAMDDLVYTSLVLSGHDNAKTKRHLLGELYGLFFGCWKNSKRRFKMYWYNGFNRDCFEPYVADIMTKGSTMANDCFRKYITAGEKYRTAW